MTEMKIAYTGQPYIPYTTFEEYSERFKPFFSMRRENGIIEVKMHNLDRPEEPADWQYGIHKGWGQIFKLVGQDPENEVLIIGGTGDKYLTIGQRVDEGFTAARDRNPMEFMYENYPMYRDGSDLIYNTVFDIHIPTIGVINGPAPGHTEFALLMDMTIMADTAFIQDPHFSAGYVPGDGQHLINHYLGGYKFANHMAYMGTAVSAEKAVDLGIVNEVVEQSKVYDRAWEMARTIMKQPRMTRRLTHDLMREPLRDFINRYFEAQFALEWWCACYEADPNFRENGEVGFKHMSNIADRDDIIK